jgi:hypothetical protein
MPTNGSDAHVDDGDKVPELVHAIVVVDDAIALAEGAQADNPTPEEDRTLTRLILRLNAERSVLDAELEAALAGQTSVQGPTEAQLAEIGELSDEVERMKNASATVSARIALATKVLEVASSVLPSRAAAA